MAFMGRGDRPSIGDNNTSNCQHGGPFLYSRFYYYIPLDNTYVIMELIATFIILIVGAITFLMAYKSTIIDPIENIKKLFISLFSFSLVVISFNKVLVPYLGIADASIREVLSVPFQQTARLAKYHDEGITKKDKKVIDKTYKKIN